MFFNHLVKKKKSRNEILVFGVTNAVALFFVCFFLMFHSLLETLSSTNHKVHGTTKKEHKKQRREGKRKSDLEKRFKEAWKVKLKWKKTVASRRECV